MNDRWENPCDQELNSISDSNKIHSISAHEYAFCIMLLFVFHYLKSSMNERLHRDSRFHLAGKKLRKWKTKGVFNRQLNTSLIAAAWKYVGLAIERVNFDHSSLLKSNVQILSLTTVWRKDSESVWAPPNTMTWLSRNGKTEWNFLDKGWSKIWIDLLLLLRYLNLKCAYYGQDRD